MAILRPPACGARPISRALRRYRSGIRPLEDRVTMSAAPWSALDGDEVSALLSGANYVQNELIVALKNTATTFADVLAIEAARDAVTTTAITAQKLLGTATVGGSSLYQLTLDVGANFADTLAAISQWTSVDWAAPNFIYTADPRDLVPNDPNYSSQFHHAKMQNPQAWDISQGSGVIVAVTDDGVDWDHVDLAANIWNNADEIAGNGIDDDANGFIDDVRGWDFSSNDNNPNHVGGDDHGTHVAGIIAAVTNNGIGVAGTAGQATIMPVRFYGSGSWTSTVIFNSYKYATDNGAKIISTSYNVDGFANDPTFASAVNYAYTRGVLHFNSAGNNNQLDPARGNFDQMLFVSSIDSADLKSSFSNYGRKIDVAAYGSSIYATLTNDLYGTKSGTSMSTPNAAAVAALIWSAHPTWTRDQVAAQLLATADNVDVTNPAFAGLLGAGRVNSFRAVTETIAPPKIKGLTEVVGASATSISKLTVQTVSRFDETTIETAANWELRSDGADGLFDTGDDVIIAMTRSTDYMIGSNEVVFNFSALSNDRYRFTAVSGAGGIVDPFGTELDGDADGTAGGDYVRIFNVVGPIAVSSSTPADGQTIAPPLTAIDIHFDRVYQTSSVAASDLVLSRGTVTGVTHVDADTVRFNVSGITADGPVTYSLAAGSVSGADGTLLGAFSATITIYADVESPLTIGPLGPAHALTLGGFQNGTIGTLDDVDTFTLDLLAGQSLSVGVAAAATLTVKLRVTGPGATDVSVIATGAGVSAFLQSIPVTSAGVYTITVESAGGIGAYTLQAAVNGAIEAESLGGAANDLRAAAQDLSGAWLDLLPGTRRAVVQGGFTSLGGNLATVGFESGALPSGWTTYSSLAGGRNAVGTSPTPAAGTYALFMDVGTASDYTLNEADWTVNLAGQTNVRLTFSHAEYGDEEEVLPTTFSGHANGDGIAMSVDGLNWIRVWNPPNQSSGVWTSYTVNLSTAAAAAGITLGANTRIRFQQYDNFEISTDGRGWDEISLDADPQAGQDDWYKVALAAGESFSTAVYAAVPFSTFELYDTAGNLVSIAEGDGIRRFVAATTGDYYLRVAAPTSQVYQLVLLTQAELDAGGNDSLATAERIGTAEYFVLGSATSTDPDDYYQLRLQFNEFVIITTTTPSVGLNGSMNLFDPALDLYDSSGNLVISFDDAVDGRNVFFNYRVEQSGVYTLRVRATESTTGAYTLTISGADPVIDPPQVVATAPVAGSLLRQTLDTLTVTFSDAVNFTSIAAADLTINGVAATGVSAVSSNTARFTFAPPANGPVNFAIAAGSVLDLEGRSVGGLNAAVTYQLNQAPVLANSQPLVFTSILEDDVANTGMLVSALLATGAGGDPITDGDPGDPEGIAVVGATTVNGAWQYSLDGGASWSALGAVTGSVARLLTSDSLTRIRFVPNANANGTDSLTLRAWDRLTGVNGGTADTTNPGGSSPFSLNTVTANLTITAVNDVPSFTKGADQTVAADGVARTINFWVAGSSRGPSNESGQTLSYIVTADNPGLFTVQPAVVDFFGRLTFTPQAGVYGTAVVSVQIRDNGGTANGGVDTSAVQTFTITTTAAPVVSAVANQTISEDGSTGPLAFTVSDLDTSFAALNVTATSNNATLVPPASLVLTNLGSGNFELIVNPVAHFSGSATITISAADGVSTVNRTFTLTVNAVNDVPSFTKGADQTAIAGSGAKTLTGWATGVSAGPNETSQTLSFLVTADNPSLFSVQPAISASGDLTYTPSAGFTGTATVSVRLMDNGGTAGGGVDTSPVQTFTIQVVAAPVISAVTGQNGFEDSPLVVDFTITDADTPAGSLMVTAASTNPTLLLNSGLSIVHLGGDNWRLTATPVPDRSGSSTITITASDGFATAQRSFTASFAGVNDAPTFTKGPDVVYPVGSNTRSVFGWATGISAGGNDTGQIISFETSNDNNGLFTTQPIVGASGTLQFTQAAGAVGTAVVTIRARDSGGTFNGGVDASAYQTFKITLTQPPVVSPIGDVTINEDGTAVVDVFVTDVDSLLTSLTVSAVAADAVLLPAAGISAAYVSGNQWRLTLSPAADRFGSTTVTVTAAEGAATGSTTFNFIVAPVNDSPSFAKGPPIYVTPTEGPFTRIAWAGGISDGPNEVGQNLTFLIEVDDPSLFTVAPTIDAAGTLRFTGAGLLGTAHVTVRLRDDGGTASGGVDTSAPQTFEIHFTDDVIPSGLLDPTFDADGIRYLSSGVGNQDVGRDVARQTDGKFVVVGYSVSGTSTSPSSVVRYNADGTLDTSFGVGGRVTIANTLNSTFFRLYAVEITTDGKILVAGDASTSGYFAARLNADGSLDSTFGNNGTAIVSVPGNTTGTNFSVGLTLQADGKAVLTRYMRDINVSSLYRIAVTRLTTSGAVDTSFGTGGHVVLPSSGSGNDIPYDVAVQSDGKIVVAGTYAGSDFFALRLESNGQIDFGFGTGGNGLVTVNVGATATNDIAYRVLLQSDGKILLGGTSGSDFGLVRLNADGTLDTTFDADGKVVTSVGTTDQGFALALQSDGKIVVGGSVSTSGNDFALARYTTAGALDFTFDVDGKKTHSFGTGSDQIYGLVIQPDGKLVVGGVATTTAGGNDFAVARFNADGALDASFGGGVATTNSGPGSASVSRMIVLPDGRILIAGMLGENGSATSGRYGVWRLLADGSLDATFGTGGSVVGGLTSWTNAGFARRSDGKLLLLDSQGNRIIRLTADGAVDTTFGTAGVLSFGSTLFTLETGLAVQSDDSILIIGYKNNTATTFDELAIVRYTADGVLDTTFDGDGQALVDLGADDDRAAAITLQSDGKLVVVGTAHNGTNEDFAVVRFNVDGTLDGTFSGDGKIVEAPSGGIDRARSVLVQADGKIVVAGIASNDFAVVRYLGDGTLDSTFSGDGIFSSNFLNTDDLYSIQEQPDGKLVGVGYVQYFTTDSYLAAFRLGVDGTLDTSFDGGDGVVTFSVGPTASTTLAGGALQSDGKLLVAGSKNQNGRFDVAVLRYLTRPTAVGAPPTIAAIADRSVAEDGTLTFTVTVADEDTPLEWLRLAASTSNSSLFPGGNVAFTSLGGGQWSVVVKPNADRFGTNVVTISVFDGTSSGAQSFQIDVTPVNDAPSFVKGADVFAGAGAARSIAGWAQNASAGNQSEFAQHLAFLVSAADPSLFDVLPTIDASGKLTFTAKASAAGQSTVVTVRLQDDGGTAAGGVDTSAPQTFTITVGNAPAISAIADQSIAEGGQAIINFTVTDIDSPTGITVTGASGDTAVLPTSGIVISNLGSGNYRLTLTPAVDRYGLVTVTVTASDGTYPSTRTFTLDVANVNDVPSFVKGFDQYVDAGAGPQTVANWAKSISSGPFETSQQRTFLVTVDDPSLFSVLPTISADGTLAYTAAAGKSGVATVTVRLQDNGGTAGGGVDTSAPQTFTIRMLTYAPIAGDFDPTFDSDGIAAAPSTTGGLESGRDTALQADGKIVVVGAELPGQLGGVVIRRLNADGSLDAGFGTGGVVRFDFGTPVESAVGVAIGGDGKIYVAVHDNVDFNVLRLNADGTLDTSFGVGGKATAGTTSTDVTTGLALQVDGKIVVVGSTASDLAATRFNADGTLDTTFATAGFARFTVGPSSVEQLTDVVMQSDGRIVAVGYGILNGSSAADFVVVRFTDRGVLDTTFSADGIVTAAPTTSTSSTDQAFEVAIDSRGRIVAAGSANGDFGVLRVNADGTIDTSFDSDGWNVQTFGGTDTIQGLTLLADGRILAVGSTSIVGATDIAMIRFNTDGSLDASFSGDGKSTFPIGDGYDAVFDAVVQADGRVVLAGQAFQAGEGRFAVVRLLADGALDPSFDGDGLALFDARTSTQQFANVARQSDGKYVVGGGVYQASTTGVTNRFAVFRYLADGTLDASFGVGGVALHPNLGSTNAIVALQADGKIVAVGSISSSAGVVRFNADGTPDATFGVGGVAALPTVGGTFTSYRVAVQADGRIVVSGQQSSNFAAARYNADGTLDTSFDGDGVMNFDAGGGDIARMVALQADGKIVLAGQGSNGSNDDFVVARLNVDGTLDATFDGDGWARTAVGTSTDQALALAVQADGKIILGGTTFSTGSPTSTDWALLRYHTNGSLDATFDGDGVVTFAPGTGIDILSAIQIQADGRIVAVGQTVGSTNDGTAAETVVARFLAGGRLDPTFAEDGMLLAPLSARVDAAQGLVIDPDGKLVVVGFAEVNGRFEGRIFRLLNEVDQAPTVAGTYVRGAAWTASFLDHLDNNGLGAAGLAQAGFGLAAGSSQTTVTIPWSNVDRITIRFDRDVVATLDSLVLYNSSGQGVGALNFRYLDGRTVEWTVPVLDTNKYLIHLDAAMVGDIADLALDGEWDTSVTAWAQGSGNGAAGGSFNFRFNVLPGDFDSSGSVAFGEIGQARLKLGQNTSSAGYLYRQDYDGSGSITFGEIGQARNRLGTGISGFDDPPTPPDSLEFQDRSERDIVAEPRWITQEVVPAAFAQAAYGVEPFVVFDEAFESVESTWEFVEWVVPAAGEAFSSESSDFAAGYAGPSAFVASPLFLDPAPVVERAFAPPSLAISAAPTFGAADSVVRQATFDLSAARFAFLAPASLANIGDRPSEVSNVRSQVWTTVRSELRPEAALFDALPLDADADEVAASPRFDRSSITDAPRGWHRLRRRTDAPPALGLMADAPSSAAGASHD